MNMFPALETDILVVADTIRRMIGQVIHSTNLKHRLKDCPDCELSSHSAPYIQHFLPPTTEGGP